MFQDLLNTINTLLGPNGCDWDKKQTLDTLKKFLIEESYELVEAIDDKNLPHIIEEIGDVFFIIIFMIKILQKDKNISLNDVLKNINNKLVRRHPHVFSDVKVNGIEEILQNWEKIKIEEKKNLKTFKKNDFDALPRDMPLLNKAVKLIKVLKSKKVIKNTNEKFTSKKEFEEDFLNLIIKADNSGYDVDFILKNKLKNLSLY